MRLQARADLLDPQAPLRNPSVTAPWSFWTRQLAGENPPLPPGHGVPVAGFFLLRQRYSWKREGAEIKIGTVNKVATYFWPVAIWQDESIWHCVVTRADRDGKPYKTEYLTDPIRIDETIVSRCCRAAITHERYLAEVKELENERDHARVEEPDYGDSVRRA
jgi:hypothetical protein